MTYSNKIKSILGIDVRARYLYLNEDDLIHDPLKYPIIHKQLNGMKLFHLI
jgi:hypothetical protein